MAQAKRTVELSHGKKGKRKKNADPALDERRP